MHPCDETDLFFEPAENIAKALPFLLSTSYCFDNIDDLYLRGNFQSSIATSIYVRVIPCSNRDSCKSEEEIDKFVEANGHFLMAMNDFIYQSEEYG